MSADLPVEVLEVSYSELASWRKCQFQHWLAYRHRYQSTKPRPPLQRGIAWDHIMNLHYTGLMEADAAGANRLARLDHPAFKQRQGEIAARLIDTGGMSDSERELAELLRWMYEGYVERWAGDPAWNIRAIQHRGLARLWLVTTPTALLDIRLKVFLDLVVTTNARRPQTLIVDHKSTSSIGHNRDTDMDDQQGLYEWFANSQDVWPEPVHGTLLNYALARRNKTKAQALDDRFQRIPANRTPIELENIAADAVETTAQMYGQPLEWQPPRSPHPEWCRRECDFLNECLLHRRGHNLDKLLRRGGFEVPSWFQGDKRPIPMDEFLDALPD